MAYFSLKVLIIYAHSNRHEKTGRTASRSPESVKYSETAHKLGGIVPVQAAYARISTVTNGYMQLGYMQHEFGCRDHVLYAIDNGYMKQTDICNIWPAPEGLHISVGDCISSFLIKFVFKKN